MVAKTLFLFLMSFCMVNCSKILIVFPTPATSHFILGNALARGLANAGHEVTMISSLENKDEKYKKVLLSGMFDYLREINFPSWQELGTMNMVYREYYLNYPGEIQHTMTNFTLEHPNFKKLISSNEKFDVIILEQFATDGLKALGCHFKAPLISFSTLGAMFWPNSLAGNPAPPSYIPDAFIGYSTKMNLFQRTMNSLFILIKYYFRNLYFFPEEALLVKKHFPECYEDFDKILYNISLTFLNSHESTNDPVPLVPSMIPIGGFHLDPPKRLPEDIQKFMDEAEDGVIYLSLGSTISTINLENSTKKAIFRALGKLRQRVLWKFDNDFAEGKPENMKIQKWFPQQDILAHPNTRLFITHGGLLSTTETVYHGVPVLSLPICADQKLNAGKMETDGYGISIWLENLTEEDLTEALKMLLNDSKYQKNAKRRSSILRDRPIKPMDLAIYWTEFIIKHQGAPHLRVGGLDLEWYQYLILDVIALVTVIILSVFFVVYYLSKLLIRKVIRNNKIKIN